MEKNWPSRDTVSGCSARYILSETTLMIVHSGQWLITYNCTSFSADDRALYFRSDHVNDDAWTPIYTGVHGWCVLDSGWSPIIIALLSLLMISQRTRKAKDFVNPIKYCPRNGFQCCSWYQCNCWTWSTIWQGRAPTCPPITPNLFKPNYHYTECSLYRKLIIPNCHYAE